MYSQFVPFFEDYTLPASAIGFLGTAVAILLGFRNNSAYERFWEARKAWGDLTNASRYFASQVITCIRPPQNQAQDTPGFFRRSSKNTLSAFGLCECFTITAPKRITMG
ncbi:bestrophin family ion channel [Nitrosomonas sp.]|uniref:bestrophin family ion channel n=1 Tax=Nitrosomonas sp. TaxID=42353 RepID=UPI00283AAB93|nr:bestrophin family ion channel [Nitrosomonas sp.]